MSRCGIARPDPEDPFDRFADSSSSDSGKPARCAWLVTAIAITVPDRWLKTLCLRMTTGRIPAWSCPQLCSGSPSEPRLLAHAGD